MIVREVRMGDVLLPVRTPISVHDDKEYTPIGIRSFGKGLFHYEPRSGDQLSKLRHFTYPANALALSNIKAWEGAIAVTGETDTKSVASSRFLFYAPRDGQVDVRYLRYYFLSQNGLAQIGQASPGSADRNRTLSISSFERLNVLLPDLDEQRRIADKLDAILATTSSIAGLAPSQETSRLLVVAELDDVLARWARGAVQVGSTCTQVNDLVRPGEDPSPAKEFVGLEHIAPHFGERIGANPLGDEKGRKFRFRPGDVLYGYLRPYLNKVWTADRHGLCSVEQYVLRPNGRMPAELIAAGLRSRTTLNTVKEHTHNLQLPRLRSGLLMAIEIPDIPPEHHEQALADVRVYESKLRTLNSLQRHRDDLLTTLRPALLNAAFSGQL